tara:strand:+ start:935 stop:1108 length:174 start_codon:yes stop_codon:yes gene_type:complete
MNKIFVEFELKQIENKLEDLMLHIQDLTRSDYPEEHLKIIQQDIKSIKVFIKRIQLQ